MDSKFKMIPILAVMLLIGFIVAGTGDLYAQSKKIICPQCGKENDAGAKFCWNDGFNLSNIQRQQETIKPVPPKISIPLIESKPKPPTETELPFGSMSSAETELFLLRLTARLEAARENRGRNSNYIGDLTRDEFRILLENTLRDQNIVRTKTITKPESGFGKFLKAIGAGTLVIFSLALLASG